MEIMFHHVNCQRLFVFTASRKVVDYWLASGDTSACCIFFLNHALVFTAFSPTKMNPHFDDRFCTFLCCTNWGSASIIAPYTSQHHINPTGIMAPHWTGAHISWLQQFHMHKMYYASLQAWKIHWETKEPRKTPAKKLLFFRSRIYISARNLRSIREQAVSENGRCGGICIGNIPCRSQGWKFKGHLPKHEDM